MTKTTKNDASKLVKIEQEGDRIRVICTSALICSLLNVSRETISDWVKRGCPKEPTQGWYELGKVIDWRYKNDTEGVSDEARKNKADADWKEAKAKKEQLALEVMQGSYYSIDQISSEWARRVQELKTSLLLLTNKITVQIHGEEREAVKQILETEIYQYLNAYARDGRYTPDPNKKRGKK